MSRLVTLLIFTVLLPTVSFAYLENPKAIIVVLKAQKNRITYYEQKGDVSTINTLKKEAQEVMRVTLNDFTDNFSFCPVYFIMDTNLALLKNKQLNGILLDNKMQPVDTKLKPVDLYLIVYFGKPLMTSTTKNNINMYSARMDVEGLVIVNSDFQKPRKYPDFIFVPEPNKSPAITQPKYNYDSNHFNIYYRGWAGLLNQKLSKKIERKNRKLNSWKE